TLRCCLPSDPTLVAADGGSANMLKRSTSTTRSLFSLLQIFLTTQKLEQLVWKRQRKGISYNQRGPRRRRAMRSSAAADPPSRSRRVITEQREHHAPFVDSGLRCGDKSVVTARLCRCHAGRVDIRALGPVDRSWRQ